MTTSTIEMINNFDWLWGTLTGGIIGLSSVFLTFYLQKRTEDKNRLREEEKKLKMLREELKINSDIIHTVKNAFENKKLNSVILELLTLFKDEIYIDTYKNPIFVEIPYDLRNEIFAIYYNIRFRRRGWQDTFQNEKFVYDVLKNLDEKYFTPLFDDKIQIDNAIKVFDNFLKTRTK